MFLGVFYIKVCACWPNEHCDMKTALTLIFDGKRCPGTQRRWLYAHQSLCLGMKTVQIGDDRDSLGAWLKETLKVYNSSVCQAAKPRGPGVNEINHCSSNIWLTRDIEQTTVCNSVTNLVTQLLVVCLLQSTFNRFFLYKNKEKKKKERKKAFPPFAIPGIFRHSGLYRIFANVYVGYSFIPLLTWVISLSAPVSSSSLKIMSVL